MARDFCYHLLFDHYVHVFYRYSSGPEPGLPGLVWTEKLLNTTGYESDTVGGNILAVFGAKTPFISLFG